MAYTLPDMGGAKIAYDKMVTTDRFDELLPAYTRSGTAYWWGADHLVVPYLANRPIKAYEQLTQEPLGMWFNEGSFTNDLLHGRDFTQAEWVATGGGADVTVTRNQPGADGTPNTGSFLTFNAPATGPKTLTGGVAGTGNKIRITSVAHGLSTGHLLNISFAAGSTPGSQQALFSAAANGLHTIVAIDADTFELNGTTMAGTFTVNGTGTSYAAIFQSITDATPRARIFQFLAKYLYLANNAVFYMTIDGGARWVTFHGTLGRHHFSHFSTFFNTATGVANHVNPKVGFACDRAGTGFIVDFAQCVQNTSLPVPLFPAAGSPTTLNIGSGKQTAAGKLVKHTGAIEADWYCLTPNRDIRTTNHTVATAAAIGVDANNTASIAIDTAPTTLDTGKLNFRYKTASALQVDQGPTGILKQHRTNHSLFTYGANDARGYDRGDGRPTITTASYRHFADTSVSVWASQNSGFFMFGDNCIIQSGEIFPAQIAT